MRRSAVLLICCRSADAHGVLTRPVSRALRFATMRDHPNISDGTQFAGSCPGESCTWYTQDTIIPGSTTQCDPKIRTMGVSCGQSNPADYPCAEGAGSPWCAPGTAPVQSPCGIYSGGWHSNGRDMLDLPALPESVMTKWTAGAVEKVAWAITANHGGGYAFRLCKADDPSGASGGRLSEECFQRTHLDFVGDEQWLVGSTGKSVLTIPAIRTANGTWPVGSTWTRNPFPQERGGGPGFTPIKGAEYAAGRGPFNVSVMDAVRVPKGLQEGHYVLSWRWDAEQTKQVWAHCSDVYIKAGPTSTGTASSAVSFADSSGVPVASSASSAASAGSRGFNGGFNGGFRARPRTAHVCSGGSLGLDVFECDAWVSLYDALHGDDWIGLDNATGIVRETCSSLRFDPCGCSGAWEVHIVCDSARDVQHIHEMYILGSNVRGGLPGSALTAMTELRALSLVDTNIEGSLPSDIGDRMPSLQMMWLDHNPGLGGEVPASLALLNLTVVEFHRSNFSGTLPALKWRDIPDCTLEGMGMKFDCPLPEGSDVYCGAQCE